MIYTSATTGCFNTNDTGNYVNGHPYFSELTTSATSGNFYYFDGGQFYPATQTITSTANTVTTCNYYLASDVTWQPLTFTFSAINAQENAIRLPAQPALLTGQTWTDWNEVYRPPLPQIVVPRIDPAAQLLRDAERKRAEEREKKVAVARVTARKTLRTLLDDHQKEQLEREGLFDLRIDDRIYRVRPGNTVQQLDATGKVLCSFCIHPYANEWLPEDDHAIAQKLLLEADEGEFLRLANRRA